MFCEKDFNQWRNSDNETRKCFLCTKWKRLLETPCFAISKFRPLAPFYLCEKLCHFTVIGVRLISIDPFFLNESYKNQKFHPFTIILALITLITADAIWTDADIVKQWQDGIVISIHNAVNQLKMQTWRIHFD